MHCVTYSELFQLLSVIISTVTLVAYFFLNKKK